MTTRIRRRIYEILDIGRTGDLVSRVADIILIGLISLNVLAVILESVPSLSREWNAEFRAFDIFSVAVFSLEYLLRVWSCCEKKNGIYRHPIKGRIRYMLTPMAAIDLLAILPSYMGLFIDLDLRFLRVMRLFRMFKLTRYSSSMSLLLQVLREEARPIGAAFFILTMLIIVSASLVYLAEHKAQPEEFGSIPAAMWWAIITITAVGYGDVTPVTVMGKVFGAAISIISVGMVAMPVGLLASGFTGAMRRRRLEYKKIVDHAMSDGILEVHEIENLEKSRESLGLSEDDAVAIMNEGMGRNMASRMGTPSRHHVTCPHCGKNIQA